MRNLIVLSVVLSCCWGFAAEPATAPPFEPSPVIQWGKPLEGGPIRVVLLLQSAKEEGLEFLRRFDAEGIVLAPRSSKYSVTSTAVGLARRELATGEVDVLVVGGIYWNKMPATLRLAILENVQEGMGLLKVDAPEMGMDTTLPKVMAADPAPDAARAVTDGIPLPLLPLVTLDPKRQDHTIYPDADHPAPTPDELVSGARFGEGRICLLNYSVGQSTTAYLYSLTPAVRQQDLPFLRTYPYWEYCHALLGKAVRWCAGRDPDVRLTVEATGEADAATPLATITVAADAAAAPVEIEAVVRDRFHDTCGIVKATASPSPEQAATVAVDLPPAQRPASGLYFVDVWARRDGKVVEYGTGWAETPAEATLTLKLHQERYAPDEPVRATIEVTGAGAEVEVAMTLTGTDGRLLDERSLPAQANFAANFSLSGAQTVVSYLEARLKQGERVLSRERVAVFAAPGPPRQFFAYSWMQGETYYTRDYLRRIQDQAVDAVLAAGGAASYYPFGGRLAAEMNLRTVPTNVVACRHSHLAGEDPVKLARPITDPATIAKEVAFLNDYVPHVAPLQPLGYSLMDEWVLGTPEQRTDYSDSAISTFRTWVQEKYADVAALNAQWGTNFASWDEVAPAQLEQAQAGVDLDDVDWSALNLSAFVDYRLFLDTVGPTAFAEFAEAIREMDPGAKVGLCGTESNSTWFGHDWYQLCNSIDFICGYGDAGSTPIINRGMRGLQREFQRSFRQPGALLSCWVGYQGSDFYRDQPLKLLLHDSHGIAFFAGQPISYKDFPYMDYDFTLSRRALDGGAGVRELRGGLDQLIWQSRRDNSGIAILQSQPSLHVASALGQEGAWGDGCVAMARAVEDAGLQYDFIAPEQLEAGILAERGYRAVLLPGATSLSDEELSSIQTFAAAGGAVIWDRQPGALDAHGRSRPEAPVIDGANVVTLGELPDDRAQCADSVGNALAQCGLEPPISVDCENVGFVPTETIVYHNGDQRLISLQTDTTDWEPVHPMATITLPEEAFVYDVREGKPLGLTQQVTATLDPMHILLYALLPYEVQGISVEPEAATVSAGAAVTVRLGIDADGAVGTHFLRVTLTAPDGRERQGFARTVAAEAGVAETVLRFALNDPAGRWIITARDAATGVVGSAALEVLP